LISFELKHLPEKNNSFFIIRIFFIMRKKSAKKAGFQTFLSVLSHPFTGM